MTTTTEAPPSLSGPHMAPDRRAGDNALIRLDKIRIDGGTQARAGLDESTVAEYREAYKNAAPIPPIVLFYDGADYWLADGFHRVAAHEPAKHPDWSIAADVRQGTRRDAVLFACGANASHGLRRTNADKRRAVETLLRDEEWRQWSDREIARRAAVSNNFVSELRKAICHPMTDEPRTVERAGTTYQMTPAARPSDEHTHPVGATFWQSLSTNHPSAHHWTRERPDLYRTACGMVIQNRAPKGSTEAGHCSSCERAAVAPAPAAAAALPPALPPLPDPTRYHWTRWRNDDGVIGMQHTKSGYKLSGTNVDDVLELAQRLSRPLAELGDHGWRVFVDTSARGYSATHEEFAPISADSVMHLGLAAWHARYYSDDLPDMPDDVIDALWLAGYDWSGRAWSRGYETIDEDANLDQLRYDLGLTVEAAAPAHPMPPAEDWQAATRRAHAIGLYLGFNPERGFSLTNLHGSGVQDYDWPSMLVHLGHQERAEAERAERAPRPKAPPAAYRPTVAEWNDATARANAIGLRMQQYDDGAVAFLDTAGKPSGGAVNWAAALDLLSAKEERATTTPTTPATTAGWWNCGIELRALQTAIDSASQAKAFVAAQALLARIADALAPLPARPRPPRDAGVSAQTKYTAELETYARALEARLGVIR